MSTTGCDAIAARTSRHDISLIRCFAVATVIPSLGFLVLEPPLRDVGAAREPDVRVILGVGDEPVEAVGPARHAGHPAVQPQRHHPRGRLPFFVERVEGLLGGLEEVVAGRIVAAPEARVVERERIRDDEPLPLAHLRVVRQVVVVRIAVVDEAAMLDDELARVLARTVAAIPAKRPLSRESLDPGKAVVDGPPFALLVHQVVLFPAVAMAANVVTLLCDGAADRRVALEGDGAREERRADLVLREDPKEAPDAHAAAVLEHRLVGQIAPIGGNGRHGVAPRLAAADAVLEQVLRALLVVHHQRDHHACAVRPRHSRRPVRIPDQITVHPRGLLSPQAFHGTSTRSSRLNSWLNAYPSTPMAAAPRSMRSTRKNSRASLMRKPSPRSAAMNSAATMTKNESAKLRRSPVMMLGIAAGMITYRKISRSLAPRLSAARMRSGSTYLIPSRVVVNTGKNAE